MNGLALYSGYGGIELGLKLAVAGYRTVCYVERELPVAARLVELMEQEVMDEAFIWSDARTFDGEPWRGKVDIITAGFPCQPFSLAGKRLGIKDPRWEWPTVRRIIDEVRPGFVFMENSSAITSDPDAIGIITGEISAMGYRWLYGVLSGKDADASQEGARWWFLGTSLSVRESQQKGLLPQLRGWFINSGKRLCTEKVGMASPKSVRHKRNRVSRSGGNGLKDSRSGVRHEEKEELAASRGQGLEVGAGVFENFSEEFKTFERSCNRLFPPAREGEDEEWDRILAENPSFEPALCGVAHGVADRVDRIRMLGNGVVPIVAAVAFSLLYERINRTVRPWTAG